MHVLLTSGDRALWQCEIADGTSRIATIGSAPGADIHLPGPSVVKKHVDIILDREATWLCAHAPVGLDSQPIVGWARIDDGVRLSIGDFELRFRRTADASAGGPPSSGRTALAADGAVGAATAAPPAPQRKVKAAHTGLT